ncbi:MAG: type IV toxin-antitoxin system AbiEi family antitoxin domain-containing protein [Parachlamydiaceae bacterium]
MSGFGTIRGQIKTEEFDYRSLLQTLMGYKKPRDAITRFLHDESIIRVKKGLYVFGENYRKGLICKESLANLIYGPSYISLEYALSYYGLIPERVEQLTSMTPLRSKTFQTPIGTFSYEHLLLKKMAVGTTLIDVDPMHHFFIATPEKALADRISFHKNLTSVEDVYSFVCEGLRIEEEMLAKLRTSLLKEIAEVYQNSAVTYLFQLVENLS